MLIFENMSRRVISSGPAGGGYRSALVVTTALLLLAGCSGCGKAGRDTGAGGSAEGAPDAVEEVLRADREFARAVSEHGLDAWVEAFHEDGAMILPTGPIATGPEAVRSAMKAAFDDPGFSLEWEPLGGAVGAAGDLAFTYGDYETRTDGDLVARGRYVTVWKRDVQGQWRVLADIGNRERD